MNLAVINCSVTIDNTTRIVSRVVSERARTLGHAVRLIGIDTFTDMFRGKYINLENASPLQQEVLSAMVAADSLVFVVPTYYKSMPGALKNFFDIVRYPDAYKDKRIGIIASNHKNQDYGARHADEVIRGMLIFSGIQAIMMPEILIQHHEAIDTGEIDRFIGMVNSYPRIPHGNRQDIIHTITKGKYDGKL